jgi:hypothetical protein
VAPVDIEEHGAELQNSTASYHLFFWSRREKEEEKIYNARGQANGWLKTLPLLDQVRLAKAEAQLIFIS